MEQPPEQVVQLIQSVGPGDEQTAEKLLPLVYDALRRLAWSWSLVGVRTQVEWSGSEQGSEQGQNNVLTPTPMVMFLQERPVD